MIHKGFLFLSALAGLFISISANATTWTAGNGDYSFPIREVLGNERGGGQGAKPG